MNSALVGFRPSPQQELLLEFGARAPVTQSAALLRGDLDSAGLRGALEAVIDRHEILRTTFVRPAGVRVAQQVVHERNPPVWRSEPGDEMLLRNPGALDAMLAQEASQPFDLAVGPLLRVAVLELATGRHLLTLTLPAACADAESMAILLREACDGAAHEPLQYADYAEWRHAGGRDEEAARPQAPPLWHGGAGGWPQSPSLLLGGRHTSPRDAPAHCRIELDAATRERVRAAAAGAHVSEAIFLEGCWHALVSRLSGERELVLAGLDHGRRQADLEGALGPYSQAVPIPTSQEGGATLAEVIDQVARARSRAARLQDKASAEDLASFAASARIAFGYVDALIEGRLGSARVEVLALTQRPAPMALQACFRSAGDELSGELWWDPAAYHEEDAT